MSMKIAIDISPLKTAHASRGIGFYTKNLVEALEQESKGAGEREIEIIPLDFSSQQLAITNQQFDLFHYPYFDLFFRTLPLRKHAKTVVTIHDVIPLVFPDHYPPGIKGWINFQIQKYSLKKVDTVITDSQSSKDDIVKYLGYPKEKIHVVYLAPGKGFRPITDHRSLITVRQKYSFPEKYILYVGDVNWNKNIPGLVKACEKVKIPLVIVGKQATEKSFDQFHPENQDLVWLQKVYQSTTSNKQSLLLRNKQSAIFLTGFVEEEDLVKIYNLATVYCQPSFYEGFGLPILEAMTCGCPVVAANTSSLPEICGDAAIMINPSDTNDIAHGLSQVLNDKNTARNLVNKGSKQVQKFSWERTAKSTLAVYKVV